MNLTSIFYVCFFGALGVLSRHLLDQLFINFKGPLKLSMLLANCCGCFIAGTITVYLKENSLSSTNQLLKILLIAYCGGLTTFSSYILNIFTLGIEKNYLGVFLFATLSMGCGLFFLFLGSKLAKVLI